ncbi:ABC-three component system middle component 7 [Sporolactobacillus pectinivorans]|uniref:ABC-three component system middle component 7 n=1 Tax=Sporolactobacillus pectinivorans TaxID=1591408 RepID=UPI000C265510|nr:ABC-three component system middle component 7 [Sporolactobacillus pectinivorans]
MILPNKLIPFQSSIIAKMTYVLESLNLERKINIEQLFNDLSSKFEDINQFILTLDVLFAIKKIELDPDEKVIKYVEKN